MDYEIICEIVDGIDVDDGNEKDLWKCHNLFNLNSVMSGMLCKSCITASCPAPMAEKSSNF